MVVPLYFSSRAVPLAAARADDTTLVELNEPVAIATGSSFVTFGDG